MNKLTIICKVRLVEAGDQTSLPHNEQMLWSLSKPQFMLYRTTVRDSCLFVFCFLLVFSRHGFSV